METPRFNLKHVMPTTDYFKGYLERLLSHLYAALICPKLIVKIILHGSSGCGKRMLASEAAKTLNLKFHVELVANIIDDNIVGTDKKIRSFFAKLSTTEPCLIYLSGCEILCYYGESDLEVVKYSIEESLKELLDRSTQPIILIASLNDFDRFSKTPLSCLFHRDVGMVAPTGENIHEADEGARWMDIGGLADIKQEIIDTIQLPIDYPQLKKSGLRRTGILLHGPPGTGKTLLAKAVATECSLKFFNVKGPELMNEYVGQSEENLRELFQKARNASPSVIFFDEIDSLAPNRGQAGDSGGVMDRMVSQLLAEFDKIRRCDDVYVIGATNRLDLIDHSLLRPGRFDIVLEVPLPVSRADRLLILQALTRKMELADDVDLSKLEELARPNMSGADFQGLCSQAMQNCFLRCCQMVESGEKTEEGVDIATRMEDFLEALADS